MMIKSLAWFAFVIACSPFLLVIAAINRMAREKGTERYREEEDDGLGEDDPGVDVDAEPINADGTAQIESMELHCPVCGAVHLDTGEWYNKPHKTHLCLECGHLWRPFERYTRGV